MSRYSIKEQGAKRQNMRIGQKCLSIATILSVARIRLADDTHFSAICRGTGSFRIRDEGWRARGLKELYAAPEPIVVSP